MSQIDLNEDFRFSHEPRGNDTSHGTLIGRAALVELLTERILRSDGGAFLLVGYRGVGKTSLTNALLAAVTNRIRLCRPLNFEPICIRLALARAIPPENLLHQIVNGIRQELHRRNLYAQLQPSIQSELNLAAMRTAATIRRSDEQTTEALAGVSLAAAARISKLEFGGKASRRRFLEAAFLPYDHCAAEQDVVQICRALSEKGALRTRLSSRLFRLRRSLTPNCIRLFFVFDELDKLENDSTSERLSAIDSLINALKTLLTSSGVTFIFIAGRGLYERWEQDLKTGDSILESIFSHVEYIPAVWDIGYQLCDELVSPVAEGRLAEELDAFRGYLAYRGRGIPRQALRALHRYVQLDDEGWPHLSFGNRDTRLFRCIAELESALANVERVMLLLRGGRDEAHLRDQDALALRYLVDWILDRGELSFEQADIIMACAKFGRIVSADSNNLQKVVFPLIRALKEANFLEASSSTGDSRTVMFVQGNPVTSWRVPRHRLIELGRELHPHSEHISEGTLGGRYLLNDLIERGGFCSVYEALDIESGEAVAVKVAHGLEDEVTRELLTAEARAIANLDHPLFPELLDDRADDSTPFLVLQLIRGKTLGQLLAGRRPAPWRATVTLAQRIIEGLEYLHARQISWGDLKPGNILVDKNAAIWLIDFGAWVGGLAEERVTVFGTPAYMAPERHAGGPPSPSSDIFSLGVLLYRCVTGRLPFDGHDVAAVARNVAEKNPIRPIVTTEVPEELDQLILSCLEKDPASRLQSAADVEAALQVISEDASNQAWEAWVRQQVDAARNTDMGGAAEYPTTFRDEAGEHSLSFEGSRTISDKKEGGHQRREHTMWIFSDEAEGNHSSPAADWIGRTEDKTKLIFDEAREGDTRHLTALQGPTNARHVGDGLTEMVTIEGFEDKTVPPLLIRIDGPAGARRITVTRERVTVGRSDDNHIRIDDHLVSRYHAELYYYRKKWMLRNLNAANGLLMNEHAIVRDGTLSAGDVIEIGNSRITVLGVETLVYPMNLDDLP